MPTLSTLTNFVACSSSSKFEALTKHTTMSEMCTSAVAITEAPVSSSNSSWQGPRLCTHRFVWPETSTAHSLRCVHSVSLDLGSFCALTGCDARWPIPAERNGALHLIQGDAEHNQEGIRERLVCPARAHSQREHRYNDPLHGQGGHLRRPERAHCPRAGVPVPCR